MSRTALRNGLRMAALFIAAGSLACWLFAGAHRGWTMTSVPARVVDEVTGIEAVVYQKRFVPGLELLGGALALAAVLAAASCLVRTSGARQPKTTQPLLEPK